VERVEVVFIVAPPLNESGTASESHFTAVCPAQSWFWFWFSRATLPSSGPSNRLWVSSSVVVEVQQREALLPEGEEPATVDWSLPEAPLELSGEPA